MDEPPVEALMLIIARDALRIGGHVRFVITLAALAALRGQRLRDVARHAARAPLFA